MKNPKWLHCFVEECKFNSTERCTARQIDIRRAIGETCEVYGFCATFEERKNI
jgi:hypothetical protein